MRQGLFTLAWGSTAALCSAQHPLINEVMPGGPDLIELYNPQPTAIDLMGYAFVVRGAAHRVQEHLSIPARGLLLVHCDQRTEVGPDHLDLRLPRSGASVLLIAPDRSTVCDLFSWPAMPEGSSIGRSNDGGSEWGFFPSPTPNASNNVAVSVRHLLEPPTLSAVHGAVECGTANGTTVRYTTDGSTPGPASPVLEPSLKFPSPTIITARAFADDALPSPLATLTLIADAPASYVALRVDPADLYDPSRGILADGAAANFSRTGKSWQREAGIELITPGAKSVRSGRIGISGSGTRSLAKKNFKVYLNEDEDDRAITGDERMLRADATPHAFLRNLFMESVARRGAHVDVQPSSPLPLYLNGAYQGVYRLMPAKNSAWLCSLSGAESVDVVDGPGLRSLKGNGIRHERMLSALLSGAPLDTLAEMLDVSSLLDLACFDLWTGRADHDLNTRCWRPRERGGRWRWILFDMDLWPPPEEHAVQRMMSATTPEAPYLPQLLAHDELRPLLLARLTAWMATALSPDRANALADSLYHANHALMLADHERWNVELDIPSPEASIASLRSHIVQRPAHLLEQVHRETGQALRRMTVTVAPEAAGMVNIEELPLTSDERTFTAIAGAPLHFAATAAPGYEFVQWQGVNVHSTEVTVDPAEVKRLRAVFRLVGSTRR